MRSRFDRTLHCALALGALVALGASDAFAHARLRAGGSLLARNTLSNKVGPCGSARTNLPTFLIAGQSLTVQWEEFIEHPGYYRIAFSPANDQGFDANVLADVIPDRPGASPGNPNLYQQVVTVPSTPCNFCTIQMIQYMTEDPLNPSLYFSCADIVILPAGSTLPSPNPSPTSSAPPSPPSPPPAPPGSSDCHE